MERMSLTARVATCLVLCASFPGIAEGQATCTKDGIDRTVYRRLLNEQFSRLASPQNANSVGNFGAYDAKDGEITFAGSTVLENGNVVALKASG